MTESLLKVQNLTKVYGLGDAVVNALDGVDLNIEKGEFTAVMGPSGSGKSTLMNILGCLDTPTSGEYYLDNQDVSKLAKNELALVRNQKLGFIFQSFNLLPRLNALENVKLPMIYNLASNETEDQQHQKAVSALESVGLGDRLNHRPSELSGGQQQRVAIARALINSPQVILADEPTGNLDSHSSIEIMELIHRLHEQGVTIVMVTHEPSIAEHAQRIICVRDGKIASDGKGNSRACLEQAQAAKEMKL